MTATEGVAVTGPRDGPAEGAAAAPAPGGMATALPLLVVLLLLVLGVISDGAFPLRYWGPVAVLALIAIATGRLRIPAGPAVVLVASVWGFGLWTLASAAWSEAPDVAVQDGARNLFGAAILTLSLVSVAGAAPALAAGRLLTIGLAALVAGTVGALLLSDVDLMLAGRLVEPLGYRNGTAALFVMCAVPLLCHAAARGGGVATRALAFSLGTTALGLAALTQSRGAALGLLAGAAVAVGLGPDRLRRTYAFLGAAVGTAAIWGPLTAPYDRFLENRTIARAESEAAAQALVVLGLVAGGIMLALALFDRGLRVSPALAATGRRVGIAVLVVLATALGGLALASDGDPIERAGDKIEEFRSVEPRPGSGARLGSTGGQRYDLWRIALDAWSDAPIGGVGQGGYRPYYYERRATDRNLSSAHSLPLGALAETGVIGLGFLVAALAAVVLVVRRGSRAASPTALRRSSALLGAAAAVLAQASIDWVWDIPGLAGLALACLGLGLAVLPLGQPPAGVRVTASLRTVSVAAAVLVVLLFVADSYTREARQQRQGSPQAQLDAARTAHRFNPLALAPRYLTAGALERLGRRDDARRELLLALERQPRNFVTMTLLGDLETRSGNVTRARRWYRDALRRNPRDAGLRRLSG